MRRLTHHKNLREEGEQVSQRLQRRGEREREELTVLPLGSVASAYEARSYQDHVQSQIVRDT